MASRTEKARKRRNRIIIIITVFVVIAGLLTAYALQRGGKSTYGEGTVKRGTIETEFSFAGNVESKHSAGITAEKAMQISDILVEEGGKVKKDDVLFKTSQGDEIKAKIDGEVTDLSVQEGETVIGGSKLCDLIDFDSLQITIKVDEYDLPRVEVGKAVSVNIGALDKDITGTVSSVSRTAVTVNGVSYFTAVIDLAKEEDIRVGMSAEAKIKNKKAENVLVLPMDALMFDAENQPYVNLKSDKGGSVRKDVTVGINDGLNVEIAEGLSEGQVVLIPKSSVTNSDFRALR